MQQSRSPQAKGNPKPRRVSKAVSEEEYRALAYLAAARGLKGKRSDGAGLVLQFMSVDEAVREYHRLRAKLKKLA